MKYGSLFSGIEAASLAWRPLGWQCAWVAEIDPFACAVLKHHYPDVPNLGDVTKVDWDAVEPVDLIVGGSPCQSFSIAGKRLGLDDPRGNLALVMLRIVGKLRPRWVLYENVPGLLSSDEGRDFGAFLGLLGELGYGFAYRILDAQYGGVPQRRRRLWVVGHIGNDWRSPAAVLFDEQSLHGDPPPGREAGERAAGTIAASSGGSDENDAKDGRDPGMIAFTSKDHGADAGDTAPTLRAMGHDGSHANGGGQVAAMMASGVRRLMPEECEALMNMPRNYTLVPYRGKPVADGPRYKAIGNSMVVTEIRWLGERIEAVIRAAPASTMRQS